MRHTFLIVTVKKMVTIGVDLWKLSQNLYKGITSWTTLYKGKQSSKATWRIA